MQYGVITERMLAASLCRGTRPRMGVGQGSKDDWAWLSNTPTWRHQPFFCTLDFTKMKIGHFTLDLDFCNCITFMSLRLLSQKTFCRSNPKDKTWWYIGYSLKTISMELYIPQPLHQIILFQYKIREGYN